MKAPFTTIIEKCKRKIVIHEVQNFDNIIHRLQSNDLVFFDDCLYSQYLFLKQHNNYLKDHEIIVVIGFSTQIVRPKYAVPIEYTICAECHRRIHEGDIIAYGAYMSYDEVKELLQEDNIYVACHGAKHLELQKISNSKLQQMYLFKLDVSHAVSNLDQLNLKTHIFVFPYAYDQFPLAYKILDSYGFHFIFGGQTSKRIQIEDLGV